MRLISALLDGHLSDEERSRLETLLRADPQARQIYMQMVDQEIELPLLLRADAPRESVGNIVPLTELPPVESAQRNQRPRRWLLAAAAMVLFMGTMAALVFSRDRGGKQTTEAPNLESASSLARETWSEDFESGAAPGWIGTLVSTNLPPGSKHAMTTGLKNFPEGDYQTIQSPENWVNGLFTLTERSTLHISYRFPRGRYVNVFMHALPADTGDSTPSMFQLRPTQSPPATQQWRTTSIPFSQFVRKIETAPGRAPRFVGGPPMAGERVAVLAFSSVEEVDFAIDRIWITPTEPSEATNQTPKP